MGLEPVEDFDVNIDTACHCEKCVQCGAAKALQTKGAAGLSMASIDADLQYVMSAWEDAPQAIRRAILALVKCQT